MIKNILGLFGIPLAFKTDNGSEFHGAFTSMCEELKIKHYTIAPHHPQANGIAERHIRTIKSFLIRYLVDK